MEEFDFKTTEEINIPTKLIEQVIGQDKAVEIIKRAAKQKRHVLLIGPPGIGKSMLAQAMAELMPIEELEDILAYPNRVMENEPIIKAVKTYPNFEYLMKHPYFLKLYTPKELNAIRELTLKKDYVGIVKALSIGLGRRLISFKEMKKEEPKKLNKNTALLLLALIGLAILIAPLEESLKWLSLTLMFGLGLFYLFSGVVENFSKMPLSKPLKPKLIVDNTGKTKAPFVDATGAKAGALLGDVKHDPFQSGGLGTPPHLRVEAGAIHKAHKGILFIDEIASLKLNWQQELLTAMQEKKYSITGQSENSSGALVKTQPAPCDFVLVAAGNLNDLKYLHPALRSRIRGNGYEVYMNEDMDDTPENRRKMVQFIAQEIKKDGKIPHFTKEAVIEIINEARRLSGRKGKLTLRLRELGGLIRAAGDLALERGHKYVQKEDVVEAKKYYKLVEAQIGERIIERKKEYQVFLNKGYEVGRVNGLAVIGETYKGLVLPIVAEVTPSSSSVERKIIATGKLGEIAKEAIYNISAIVKKALGPEISEKDIHIQFLQTYEGVEGDSASIAVALAVLSAYKGIPIDQSVAMTGSLDIRGKVLPVGGVTAKVEAAEEAGLKKVIIPKMNEKDVIKEGRKIKIIGVERIEEVLEHSLKDSKEKKELISLLKKLNEEDKGDKGSRSGNKTKKKRSRKKE